MGAAPTNEQEWLGSIHAATLGGDWGTAGTLCSRARDAFPNSSDLRRVQAGIYGQLGRAAEAEALFRALLAQQADDAASAFGLARLLEQQGRTAAAASTLRTWFASACNGAQPDIAISAIELLDDCGRTADAAAMALDAVALAPMDARLHAYAFALQMQLGEFASARTLGAKALSLDPRAWEWHVPLGLANAQRYADAQHPDFGLFRTGLARDELSAAARAELRFALGKAHDDIGGFAAATQHLRAGNHALHTLQHWPRKEWRRMLKARLTSPSDTRARAAKPECVPIFIVGMPRSGTTLLATLLAGSSPRIRLRGELDWIERLTRQINPNAIADYSTADLERAASVYAAHLRQDDAGDAQWFIDKQPLNFRYIDLILALFPNARILRCRRSPRDTALSLWLQCFRAPALGFSYDFDDIAHVMDGELQLMAHWQARYAEAIHEVRYEALATDPAATLAGIMAWLGARAESAGSHPGASPPPLATSSLWQARQPVYTRSIGRWEHYATLVPELLRFPA